MLEGFSLINMGDMSKPADTLIKKISDAVGGYFEPRQIIRVAKARAEADEIKTLSKIKMTELERRAMLRLVQEESRKQNNIESITSKAILQLNKEAEPENVDNDWIANLFDKCRLVSDEEMQGIWAKILAGEANAPGKYSKRTVNFMESLDKQDAHLFAKLCAFNWIIGEMIYPIIYDLDAEIYKNNGISFSDLKHLDVIGLISFENFAGYKVRGLDKSVISVYKNSAYLLEFPYEKDNQVEIGKVVLTGTGKELVNICNPETLNGFDEYILSEWRKQGVKITPKF